MTEQAPLRIVVGSDDAGLQYKNALKKDRENDPRVAHVVDVGVGSDEHTAYPHVAVNAARMAAEGKADRALLVCGTGLGVAISANKGPQQIAGRARAAPTVECDGAVRTRSGTTRTKRRPTAMTETFLA
ncbi:RpiB/LacA/LacB family sugar-phosphate isomerase [Saccharopolyspora sp. ASAGF58]|uniref:RpiB/LacA/LacB family sugar-phosphate isomerase n=1 Tax=Saccharopolyspora sp. ASAGF58 TaxID=2719023 RepID=UPI0027393ED9|nr:RpiB/LacA/LacB family sugar-phosphate isomerase [Saccharopolyspora sp. ASAGF58]